MLIADSRLQVSARMRRPADDRPGAGGGTLGGPGQRGLEAFSKNSESSHSDRTRRRLRGPGIRLQGLENSRSSSTALRIAADGRAGWPGDHFRHLIQLLPELYHVARVQRPHRLGSDRHRGRFSSRRNERQTQLAFGVDHLYGQFIAGGHREATSAGP
jgi:hypothetical protein